MKKLISLLLILGFFQIAHAQWPGMGGGGGGKKINGKITGTLVDSISGQPVSYATLVLKNEGKSREKDGALSDEDGSFRFDLKTGAYDIYISFLGYADKKIDSIALTLKSPDNDLGKILLVPSDYVLDEVEITGERSLFENKADKIVYNVEQDASVAGGDATDVLRMVPLLTVDLNGNVSLRGSSNVLILVNGKPSGMFANNVADALKMFPADQIKKVEVITSPSAKYDGEGSAGIINIVTKRENIEGISGSVNASVGNRQNSLFASLNAGKGRFGLSSNGSMFLMLPQDGVTSFERFDDGVLTTFNEGITETSRLGQNGSVNAFYDFNAFNAINASATLRGFGFETDGTASGFFTVPGTSQIDSFERTTVGDNYFGGFDVNLDYTKTFPDKKDQELVIAGQISKGDNNQENVLDENHFLLTDLNRFDSEVFNDGDNLEQTIQIDYTQPLPKSFKLETGAKYIDRTITSDYITESRTDDPVFTNLFNYGQDVTSGYASLSFVVKKKYSFITGLRYEHTAIDGDWESASIELQPFENSYDNWLPNITISRSFSGFRTLKASYNRRIQRPNLFFINPFNNNTDVFNRTIGTPDLLPELVDQYELSYNTSIAGATLFLTGYYKNTTDVIEQILEVSDGISINTFSNIGTNQSVGTNIFATKSFNKLTVRAGGNLFTYNATGIVDGQSLEASDVLYNAFWGGDYAFTGTLKLDFFGFFRSPQRTIQGTNPSFSIYGMGMRKEFKDWSLGFRLIEPFNANKSFDSDIVGNGFEQRTRFSIPFRSIGVNFRYKFGKVDFKKRNSKVKNTDQKAGEEGQGGGGGGAGGGGMGGGE
jgi:outer membrane receptor protein involved in Fe transport